MATATANTTGNAAQVTLTDDMEIGQALVLVSKGMVSAEAYMAWDARRMERVKAAAAGERRKDKGCRVTISEKGMVVLNGSREKGEGFAPWFLPAEIADLCENVAAMAQAVVDGADAVVAGDAVVKDQVAGWQSGQSGARFEERPHGRRGKSKLAWEGVTGKSGAASRAGREASERADVVKRCKAFLAKLQGK